MTLPIATSVTSSDHLVVYSSSLGYASAAPLGTVLSYFEETFASPEFSTQAYVPTTGFSIGVTSGGNRWILLQPGGTLATGTITLPDATSAADGTEVLITSTQIITSLTISLNGATAANGAPTTLGANGFAKLRFYSTNNSWYRVG